MMGMRAAPERLFYDFCLEERIPADHLLRRIDRFLDLSELRATLRPFYSRIGRPSIDPELMIRMLIVGYCFAIRSERRLCEEVHLNLAYRWFCRLGLDGKVPDHSTFSLNRNGRFRQSDVLRHVFEATVARCIAEGLVGGEGFVVDASLIQADANKQRSVPGHEWRIEDIPADATQAVKDYLATLDDAAFGAATEVTPKFVSPSDPAAQWTGAMRGPAFFAYGTNLGSMYCGLSEKVLRSKRFQDLQGKVQLVFTSPPFPLNKKKRYGNLQGDAYVRWLARFAPLLRDMVTDDGSIVIEVGNAWMPGEPVMSTDVLEALLRFLKKGNLHLCQEFIWYNPARLPSPIEWVNRERVRVKDAFTRIWWMSPTTRPKADNRKVLREYSPSMRRLIETGKYNAGGRITPIPRQRVRSILFVNTT